MNELTREATLNERNATRLYDWRQRYFRRFGFIPYGRADPRSLRRHRRLCVIDEARRLVLRTTADENRASRRTRRVLTTEATPRPKPLKEG